MQASLPAWVRCPEQRPGPPGFPARIVWSSKDPKLGPKVTSVQFAELNGAVGYTWGAPAAARPDIADNHADASSAAAAEIYAAGPGTATMGLLGLSYVSCL
jgi:hypothetical protein